jgi:hypothetical protein
VRQGKSGQALLFGWWGGGCRDTREPKTGGHVAQALRHPRVVKHKSAQEPAAVFTPRMAGRAAMGASDREPTAKGHTTLRSLSSSLLAGHRAAQNGQAQTSLAQRRAALVSMTALVVYLWA